MSNAKMPDVHNAQYLYRKNEQEHYLKIVKSIIAVKIFHVLSIQYINLNQGLINIFRDRVNLKNKLASEGMAVIQ